MRVVSVVHQEVVLPQERRFVHHGKQEVETGKINLDLFPIWMVRFGDIIKGPDKGNGGEAY
jgi:hypothetical protein